MKRILVIGAGVGGLTTAALLAQAGYRVTVLEAQTYPGGSASSFFHQGYRFESGATVAGGFQPDGPHAVAARLLGLEWQVQQHDPAWVTHLPGQTVALRQDHTDMLAQFPHTAAFWQQQSRIAALAWRMSAAGLPFPPRSGAEVLQLAKVALQFFPADVQLLPFALGSVGQWLRWHGLAQDKAFVRLLDATLLISAQTTADHVNALYGATALDLARQGVYHVAGGIGGLAETLVDKVRALGGEVLYRQVVTRIQVTGGRVTGVYATRGRRSDKETLYPADFVIANVTPWSLKTLLGDSAPRGLRREVQQREPTWGAFVLHLGVQAAALPAGIADHHQIIKTLDGPMGEGETLFISMSPAWDTSRAPAGYRAVTVSTHTRIAPWWELLRQDEAAYYARKEAYAARIIQTIDGVIPGFAAGVDLVLPGTPVTYAFYTLREQGMVGGFAQTSLLRARGPRTGIANLRLVGDSIFPGQSTAGVTLGGLRVAQDVQHSLPLARPRHFLPPLPRQTGTKSS
ncbi:MAG: NAD(P)/FAD-dependent oxidoreductase [Anaerolineae bacterium]|nr:NAD(P)/FAD-dependent oxidoreductase [Anaerolineae bacterium]